MSMRCKITGHDLDECGKCRRCGDESSANHAWSDAERNNPCYKREICDRCGAEREQPDHDWQPGDTPGPDGVALQCARCGLKI
jgi:hypothetical protein